MIVRLFSEKMHITKDKLDNEEYRVSKSDTQFKYENLQTGEVTYTKIATNEYKEDLAEQVNTDKLIETLNKILLFMLQDFPKESVDGDKYYHTVKMSSDIVDA